MNTVKSANQLDQIETASSKDDTAFEGRRPRVGRHDSELSMANEGSIDRVLPKRQLGCRG